MSNLIARNDKELKIKILYEIIKSICGFIPAKLDIKIIDNAGDFQKFEVQFGKNIIIQKREV